jgi:hypothetical protein
VLHAKLKDLLIQNHTTAWHTATGWLARACNPEHQGPPSQGNAQFSVSVAHHRNENQARPAEQTSTAGRTLLRGSTLFAGRILEVQRLLNLLMLRRGERGGSGADEKDCGNRGQNDLAEHRRISCFGDDTLRCVRGHLVGADARGKSA